MGTLLLGKVPTDRTRTLLSQAKLGATFNSAGTTFLVWAPNARNCEVHILYPGDRSIPMQPLDQGYFGAIVEDCPPGSLYSYCLDGGPDRPDPASRFQPRGVHGPSEVVAPQPNLDPRWRGLPLEQYVIYELHTGTFTEQGTFDAAISQLDRLKSLGITAVEIMPVAEFPGARNWGYDGVQPYAASSAYGGPEALRRFVDACHQKSMAVVLDVVYNHLGPEGNYLREFGPYFHSRYQTGWGDALNFNGPHSDEVRRYFIENALYWVNELGFDALRIDAVHAIYDRSATPFLTELAEAVHTSAAAHNREVCLIAESDLNDARVVTPPSVGGHGFDAQWADDLHHAIHVVLSGQRDGYYADYSSVDMIAQALQRGWIYSGQYSRVRERKFGNSPAAIAAKQFVVCAQNHDQIGNRMRGERLEHLAGFDAAKLAAATVILSPYVPLLFMGEEYAEPAPFLYFVSHGDTDLQEAVRSGRRREFAAFAAFAEPPDPQDEATFLESKLHPELIEHERHAEMYDWYRRLLQLRREHPALKLLSKEQTVVSSDGEVITMRRRSPQGDQAIVLLNFSREARRTTVVGAEDSWNCVLGECRQQLQGETWQISLEPLQCIVFSKS